VRGIELAVGVAGEAIAELLVLQLLEEIDRAAPGNAGFREELRAGRVGRDSCARLKARYLPSAACCPAMNTPIAASPAPAAAAAAPSSRLRMVIPVAGRAPRRCG
jgi:hypothetical protein